MTEIKVYDIDSNIPVPAKRPPLRALDVGQSILFPMVHRPSVQSYASRLKKNEGMEFTIKKIDAETARIWRTK